MSRESICHCWQVAFLHCCAFAALHFYIVLFLFFRIFRRFVWSALRRESQRHCWQVAAWEEAFRAQYGQLHNYNQRFQLLFVQNPLLEINFCCRHISENFAFISFSHSHTSRSGRNSAPSSRKQRHMDTRELVSSIQVSQLLCGKFEYIQLTSALSKNLNLPVCCRSIDAKLWILNGTQIQWGNPPKIQLLRVHRRHEIHCSFFSRVVLQPYFIVDVVN